MKRTPRRIADLRLKIAILESRRTQRRVAADLRMAETRLSEIVGRREMPATPDEMTKIAKYLDRPIDDLFTVVHTFEEERAS
jgi:hypothetical protein